MLGCGNHHCEDTCHQGPCQTCTLLPEAIITCPCGARELADLSPAPRQSCLDPIPTCGGKCRKPLKCGPPSKYMNMLGGGGGVGQRIYIQNTVNQLLFLIIMT